MSLRAVDKHNKEKRLVNRKDLGKLRQLPIKK